MTNSVNILTNQDSRLVDVDSLNIDTTHLRESIKELLRNFDAKIVFTKKDGTDREILCTLREGVAIPYEKKTERTRETITEILPVWDTEANSWRSVNITTIKSMELI